MTDYGSPWYGANIQQDKKKGFPIQANVPFYLTHHPANWELVEEETRFCWLPQLSKLHEMPGVNGVQGTKNGVDSFVARAKAEEEGKTVLSWDLGYLTRYPAKNGYYYCVIWSHPKKIGNRVIHKLDQKGWNDFRRSLLENGLIEPMDEDLISILSGKLESRLNRLHKDQHLPKVKEKMDQIAYKIHAMKNTPVIPIKEKKTRKRA